MKTSIGYLFGDEMPNDEDVLESTVEEDETDEEDEDEDEDEDDSDDE